MARQKCTFKLQGKRRLNGKRNVRLNGKEKVYV